MRTLTDHIVSGDQAVQLEINVTDKPGAGGANHAYSITWRAKNADDDGTCWIHFQEGPIKEVGINGVTHEALLAIVIDRLRSFQEGPFPSPFNATALDRCEDALRLLQQRTRDRIARGVEGLTKT
jgi:hypothetical protein